MHDFDIDDDQNDYLDCCCPECDPDDGPDDDPDDGPVSEEDRHFLKVTLIDNVKRGVFFLDQQNPGWREKVQLDDLDLSSGCSCVLGQLYNGYSEGLYHTGISESGYSGSHYGFDVPEGVRPRESAYDVLTELWQDFISESF